MNTSNAQDNLSATTPLPWRTARVKSQRYADDPYSRGDVAIVDERDRILAECFERVALNEDYPAPANAEFIVRAANNFDTLLEALEFCRSVIEANGVMETSERMALDKADIAIAKARG